MFCSQSYYQKGLKKATCLALNIGVRTLHMRVLCEEIFEWGQNVANMFALKPNHREILFLESWNTFQNLKIRHTTTCLLMPRYVACSVEDLPPLLEALSMKPSN